MYDKCVWIAVASDGVYKIFDSAIRILPTTFSFIDNTLRHNDSE